MTYTTFSYAEVRTIETPTCTFDQFGNCQVTYAPTQFVSYCVEFPTVAVGTGYTHAVILPQQQMHK